VSAPGAPKTRVVYVLSSPHSGSTLLGIILGGHPEVVFGGELIEIPHPAWTGDRNCSCGLPGGTCPFWTEVKQRTEGPDGSGLGLLRRDRVLGWKAFPRALLGARLGSAEFRRQVLGVQRLAQAIGETAGRPIVVDSSKGATPGLAYLHARSEEFEVQFIHLIRDGRGVVASRKNHHIRAKADRDWLRTAALRYSILWVFANLMFLVFFSHRPDRYLRVRYEDLISDPVHTFERIGRFVHLDLTEVGRSVATGTPFPAGHVVAGNRMRLDGGVRVNRNRGSESAPMPPEDRRVYRWVAGWFARLNGYG
jgi:hypothetical protein